MRQQKGTLSEKHKKLIAGLSIALFLILSAVVFVYIGEPMLKFVSDPASFRQWVGQSGFAGRLIFLGMMVLQVFVAVIPGEPLEIAAGYAFGIWEGTFLCLLGATIGSVIIFAFVRRFGVKAVEIFFSREKIHSLKFLHNQEKLNLWIFIIFFIPGTPKDLLSYFVGLTDIKFSTWIFITFFARIPSIITSTVGGDALGLQNYDFAIIVFAVTLIISIAGLLIYRKICAEKKERDHEHR